MSHPYDHARSSAKKWGGDPEEYLKYHEWFDETKAWVGHSVHRMFRHHSEGIFECEKIFGNLFYNSVGKRVYIRYIGEQHVKEDCNGYIPSAKEWVDAINNKETPLWMLKTQKIED
jgi:hypothetical protein